MANFKSINGSEGSGTTDKSNTLHLYPMPVAWDYSKVREFVKNQCESQEVKNANMFVFKPADEGGQFSESVYIRFSTPNACHLALSELKDIELNGKKVKVEISTTAKPNFFKQNTKEKYNNKKKNNDGGAPLADEGPPSLETYGLSVGFLTSLDIQPPLRDKVYVSNIDFNVSEASLRELMGVAGLVLAVALQRNAAGEPQGRATVQYDHPVEAVQAISMLHGQEYFGRKLVVVMNKYSQSPLPRGLAAAGAGLAPGGEPLRAVRAAVDVQPLKRQLDRLIYEVQRLTGENISTDNFTPYGMGVFDNSNMPNFGPNMPPFFGPMPGPFMPQMNGPFVPGPNMPMPGPNMPMPGPNMPMPGPNMPMPGPNMLMPGPNMLMSGPNMPMPGPNMPMPGPNMLMPGLNMSMPGPNMPMLGPNMATPPPNMPTARPIKPTPKPSVPHAFINIPAANSIPSPPGTSPVTTTASKPAASHRPPNATSPAKPLIKIKQPEKFSRFTPIEKPAKSEDPSKSKASWSSKSKPEKHETPSTSKRDERSGTSRHERWATSKHEKRPTPDSSPDADSANKNEDLKSRFQELLKGRSKPTLDVLEGFMDQVMSLTKTMTVLREIVPKEKDDSPPRETRVSKWDQLPSRSKDSRRRDSSPETSKRDENLLKKLSGFTKQLELAQKSQHSQDLKKGYKGDDRTDQVSSPDHEESGSGKHKRKINAAVEMSSSHGAKKQRRVDEPAAISSDMLMFSNLPPSLSLSALSAKMREVGALRFAELTGRGRGVVRFHRVQDARACVQLFHRSKVDGQIIEVQPF